MKKILSMAVGTSASRTALAAAILIGLFATGCKEKVNQAFKPDVTGRNSEVLVVINHALKEDTVGRYLHHILDDVFLGLPADESIFDMHTVPPAYFDRNMHYFRNLVLVNVADTVQTDTICYYKDVWARQQAVVSINAKTKEAVPPMLKEHHVRMVSYFTRAERDRLMRYYDKIKDASIISELQNRWGITLNVPNSFVACSPEHKEQVSWYMNDTKEFTDGLVVYDFPYSGPRCMSKLFLLNKRDSLLRANIGGPQGSVMCTEVRHSMFDEIVYKFGPRMHQGLDVAELRGLWRLDDYPMGGPFIMRAVHDTASNRVVVTDGYVYYPSREQKRNHVRQLEAIMYSLKMAGKK